MAFSLPNKAFQSFTLKQCVNALYRAGSQLDAVWDNESERGVALENLQGNVSAMILHEEDKVRTLADQLLSIFPSDKRTMQEWLMLLERMNGTDLVDSDFLVSTEDEFDKEHVETKPIHLVLDNLRSSFNVGSLLRTAEALGIEEVHLCGYTPTPENAKTKKSALGTDNWVKWTYHESTLECLDELKKAGVNLYAFETAESAKELSGFHPKFPAAIVLGNERYGLASPTLKRADDLLKINLAGKKNSLNVGTCGAIALHYFANQL